MSKAHQATAVFCLGLACSGLVVLLAAAAGGQAPESPAAIAIRRIQVSPAQLTAEMERVRQGILVPLSRQEFEERVLQAGGANQGKAPRLLRASYSATLGDQELINGRGQWTVFNASARPAILGLPGFNLAVSHLRTTDNRDAVIAELDGKSLGLLLEKIGSETIYFDWSLRGSAVHGGQAFVLHVPPCASASLELKLPVGDLVSVSPKVAMLSGPDESGNAKFRLWRLHFTGRSQIDFVVQKGIFPSAPPLVLANIQSRQQLVPGRCLADFEYHIEVLHGATDRLAFACDPGLEPYDVSLRNFEIKGWEIKETPVASLKGKPALERRLLVSLHEPVSGTLAGLKIRCMAPFTSDRKWTSPGLQLREALTRGEVLMLTLHPEVQLEKWQSGPFQLLRSTTESDGSQTLILGQSGASDAGRPEGIARFRGVELLARQKSWWQLGPSGLALTSEILYEIQRGRLFQLAVLLPSPPQDWTVESVHLSDSKKPPNWVIAGNRLLIDPERPLSPAEDVTLQVQLRSARRPWSSGAADLHLVDIAPADPCLHAGDLAVMVDRSLQARVVHGSSSSGYADVRGPWGKSPVDFFFTYRNQPVAGILRVQPRPARLRSRIASEVVIAGPQAAWQARLELEPMSGKPAAINLFISGPATQRFRLKADTDVVGKLVRLPVDEALPHLLSLGCRSPLETAALEQGLPRGQRWRLELARPLSQAQTITLEATLQGAPSGQERHYWEIPIVSVLEAERGDMDVAIQSPEAEIYPDRFPGLRDMNGAGRQAGTLIGAPSGRVSFRSDPTSRQFPSLTCFSRPERGIEPGSQEVCDRALLVTELRPDGVPVHSFRFHIQNWRKPNLALVLPSDADRVLGVRVDGRWSDTIPQTATPQGMQVLLPVPREGPSHQLEIVYLSKKINLSWPFGVLLQAPAPQMPIAPLSMQRRWRIPPGMTTLSSSAWRQGAPSDAYPGLDRLRQAWHLGESILAGLGLSSTTDWLSNQRKAMLAADATLRKKSRKNWNVGWLLQYLAMDQLKEQTALVLDTDAFRMAGLAADTPLPTATAGAPQTTIWESAGLVYIPCPAGVLLTSRAWFDSQSASTLELATSLGHAVEEAAIHGQDASGRFQTAETWLSFPEINSSDAGRLGLPNPLVSGWTEWEQVAGTGRMDEITIVQPALLNGLGLILGVILFSIAWVRRKKLSRAWRFRLWLVWLGVAGLAWLWAPSPFRPAAAWLVLAAVLVAVVGWARSIVSRGQPNVPAKAKNDASPWLPAAGITLLALTTSLCWLNAAYSDDDIEPVTVYLLTDREAGKQTVLVPAELLKRLDKLAGNGSDIAKGAVILGARYSGTVHATAADIKAEFSCYNFAERSQLFIPLDGVDLKPDVFVAGKPVDPVVAPAPQIGYLVPVEGKGKKKVELSFVARVSQSGDSQELKFSIPGVVQNEITDLLIPDRFQGAQCVNALGRQTVTRVGANWSLQAEVGPENLFHVRWRTGAPAAGVGSQIKVRELYFWDLRLPAPALTGILQYSIAKGKVSQFTLGLPEGLEVRSVEAGPMPKSAMASAGPRLKAWSVQGKKQARTLTVDLAEPMSGGVQLKLGLVPQLTLQPGAVALPLPFPLQVKPAGFLEGFLAYRLETFGAGENPKDLGMVGIEPEVFAKVWHDGDPGASVQPTRAFNFRRTSPAAYLGLTLFSLISPATQELTWQIQRSHADLTVTCHIKSSSAELVLVEWLVPPPVVVAQINGPHVHSWTREGPIVQVWLTAPQKETRMTLWGWLPNAKPVQEGKTGLFTLPAVSLRQPFPAATLIRLRPAQGLSVVPASLRGLQKVQERESSSSLAYNVPKSSAFEYGGSFQLTSESGTPMYRSFSIVRSENEQLVFTSHLQFDVPTGGSERPVTVELQGWPDRDVFLEAADVMVTPIKPNFPGKLAWLVRFPPGLPGRVSMRLQGRSVDWKSADQVMPKVMVYGAHAGDRYIAATPDLAVVSTVKLQPTLDLSRLLNDWPDEVKPWQTKIVTWKVLDDDWALHVQPRRASADPTNEIVSWEQEAFLTQEGGWIHEARFLLFSRHGGDVTVILPDHAKLLDLEHNGLPTPPGLAGQRQRIALGSNGIHIVRLHWRYDTGDESLEKPNLTSPRIADAGDVPIMGTLWLPAGYRADVSKGNPLSSGHWLLRQARSKERLSSLLAKNGSGNAAAAPSAQALQRTQQEFYWLCRQIEHLANRLRDVALLKEVQDLRQDNERLAEKLEFVKVQKAAAKKPAAPTPTPDGGVSLRTGGIPVHWEASAARPADLHLIAVASDRGRDRFLASQILLLALASLGILSFLPIFWRWWRVTWPEQVLFVSILGWFILGPSLPGIVLILFAITARLVLLAIAVQRWFSRRIAAATGSGVASAP